MALHAPRIGEQGEGLVLEHPSQPNKTVLPRSVFSQGTGFCGRSRSLKQQREQTARWFLIGCSRERGLGNLVPSGEL